MASELANDAAAVQSPARSWLPAGVASVLVAYVASRLIIFVIIEISTKIVGRGHFAHSSGWLAILTDWDSAWYIGIADQGYSFKPGEQSNIGFFPFYPMLIWLFAQVLQNYGLAAVVVSHLCLLVAGLLLNALIHHDYKDARLQHAAAMFFMFNAVSFFYSDAYSESTFVMLSLAALLAARKGHWLTASLCGMCLAATRQVGVLIVAPLLIEFVRSHWDERRGLRSLLTPRILFLAFVPMGVGLFMLYGYIAFGDPMVYLKAAAVWERTLTPPWITFSRLDRYEPFYRVLFVGSVIVGFALWGIGIYLKVRASYLVYAAILMAIYLSSNSLEAIPRYLSVIFPFYIVLALVARRYGWSYMPLLAGSVALLALCTVLSANGYWMT